MVCLFQCEHATSFVCTFIEWKRFLFTKKIHFQTWPLQQNGSDHVLKSANYFKLQLNFCLFCHSAGRTSCWHLYEPFLVRFWRTQHQVDDRFLQLSGSVLAFVTWFGSFRDKNGIKHIVKVASKIRLPDLVETFLKTSTKRRHCPTLQISHFLVNFSFYHLGRDSGSPNQEPTDGEDLLFRFQM